MSLRCYPLAQASGCQFEQLLGRKAGRDKPELIPGIFEPIGILRSLLQQRLRKVYAGER